MKEVIIRDIATLKDETPKLEQEVLFDRLLEEVRVFHPDSLVVIGLKKIGEGYTTARWCNGTFDIDRMTRMIDDIKDFFDKMVSNMVKLAIENWKKDQSNRK